jgi:hypothetical protein
MASQIFLYSKLKSGGELKQVKFGNVTVGEGGNWIHYVEEGDDNPLPMSFANEINLRRNYNNYNIAILI